MTENSKNKATKKEKKNAIRNENLVGPFLVINISCPSQHTTIPAWLAVELMGQITTWLWLWSIILGYTKFGRFFAYKWFEGNSSIFLNEGIWSWHVKSYGPDGLSLPDKWSELISVTYDLWKWFQTLPRGDLRYFWILVKIWESQGAPHGAPGPPFL